MLESPTFADNLQDSQLIEEENNSDFITPIYLSNSSIPGTIKESKSSGVASKHSKEDCYTDLTPSWHPVLVTPVSPTRLSHQLIESDILSASKPKAAKRETRQSTADKIQQFFAPYESPGPEEYPSPEDYEMESRYTQLTKQAARKRQSSVSISAAVSERFGWLKNKAFAKPGAGEDSTHAQNRFRNSEDPLLSLDIHTSLFPHGEPDYMEPSAFHNLLANAEAVIMKFQAAYHAKCEEVQQLSAEKSSKAEELDESETRARHLKIQLDDMSCRMAKNEQDFDQKFREEQIKRTELEARWRMVVEESSPRRWGSDNSDSGFESESESEPKTPVSAQFFPPDLEDSPGVKKLDSPITFSRLKGLDFGSFKNFLPVSIDTYDSNLRNENQDLKSRIAELEAVVDSCLLML